MKRTTTEQSPKCTYKIKVKENWEADWDIEFSWVTWKPGKEYDRSFTKRRSQPPYRILRLILDAMDANENEGANLEIEGLFSVFTNEVYWTYIRLLLESYATNEGFSMVTIR